MSRRRLIPVLTLTLVLAIGGAALSGCVAPQNNNNDEVLAKLDAMQAQIDDLQAAQREDGSSGDEGAGSDGKSDDTPSGQNAATSASSSVDDLSAQLDDLSARVDEAVATAGKVSVPANAPERPRAYFDAKQPLEELERELDVLEDAIEVAYREGSITREDVWALEKKEDAIDSALDRAGDDLELRMGVDD